MNLYLISRNVDFNLPALDVYNAHVIRCETEERCRYFATLRTGDEGTSCWFTAEITLLASNVAGEAQIILSDYHAG